jgi:hypothetical protein
VFLRRHENQTDKMNLKKPYEYGNIHRAWVFAYSTGMRII